MKRSVVSFGAILVVLTLLGSVVATRLRPPRLPVPARRDWVFPEVTILEPGRPALSGRTLRIREGRIASISASSTGLAAAAVTAPAAPDLAGTFVVPGLVDMHVHYPPSVAVGNAELWSLLLLAHGVTTIRETGSIDGSIFAVREAIRAGHRPGPRIFACGALLDGHPPSFPSNLVVRTPAEARAAVEEQAAQGADCIKVYNMLTAEALTVVRETATAFGLPVVGHAPHSVSLEEAGLVDLQHGTGAVRVDLQRVGRLDFRLEDWGTVDDERIAFVARLSLAQGIAHTPTLVNARMRQLLVEGAPVAAAMARDTGLRHLPEFWPSVWALLWSPPFVPGDATSLAVHERFRTRQASLTASLHAAGVRIHAGTDTLMPFVAPGSSLHGELAELVSAGLTPEAAWRIATRDAGETLGVPGLGSVEVGAPADLLFLRADPRRDLGALTDLEAVLVDGRLYRRAELEQALARLDAHFHGWLYRTVMGGLVRLVSGRFAPERGDSDQSEPHRPRPPRVKGARLPGPGACLGIAPERAGTRAGFGVAPERARTRAGFGVAPERAAGRSEGLSPRARGKGRAHGMGWSQAARTTDSLAGLRASASLISREAVRSVHSSWPYPPVLFPHRIVFFARP